MHGRRPCTLGRRSRASVGTQITTTNTKIAGYDSAKAAAETARTRRDT